MGGDRKRVNVLAGSHIPVLVKLLEATNGAVIELGAGFNSTPLLYWYCKANDRYFASYENDEEWIRKVDYPINFVTEWDNVAEELLFLDIVLIDHRPAKKRRSSALRFKNKARFVVLHDSELADNPAYKYTSIYSQFKYKHEFTSVVPHTMVLSNFIDPEQVLTPVK